MEQEKHDQGNDENDPTGKLVEKPLGLVWIPVLHQQAGANDAQTIGQNCDRDGRQCQDHADRSAGLEQVSINDGQCSQRHQGANSAAGFRDFQRHGRQLNDVAFAQNGHAHQRQGDGSRFRSE